MDEEVLKLANNAMEQAVEAHKQAVEANKNAHLANTRVNSHEDLCAERYKHILEKMQENAKKIDGIQTKAWWVAGTIITVLLSAFGGAVLIVLQQLQ